MRKEVQRCEVFCPKSHNLQVPETELTTNTEIQKSALKAHHSQMTKY